MPTQSSNGSFGLGTLLALPFILMAMIPIIMGAVIFLPVTIVFILIWEFTPE